MFFNLFFGLHRKLNRKVTVHIIVLVKYSALRTAANTTRNFHYFLMNWVYFFISKVQFYCVEAITLTKKPWIVLWL